MEYQIPFPNIFSLPPLQAHLICQLNTLIMKGLATHIHGTRTRTSNQPEGRQVREVEELLPYPQWGRALDGGAQRPSRAFTFT